VTGIGVAPNGGADGRVIAALAPGDPVPIKGPCVRLGGPPAPVGDGRCAKIALIEDPLTALRLAATG